jgi:hypothetical protein
MNTSSNEMLSKWSACASTSETVPKWEIKYQRNNIMKISKCREKWNKAPYGESRMFSVNTIEDRERTSIIERNERRANQRPGSASLLLSEMKCAALATPWNLRNNGERYSEMWLTAIVETLSIISVGEAYYNQYQEIIGRKKLKYRKAESIDRYESEYYDERRGIIGIRNLSMK